MNRATGAGKESSAETRALQSVEAHHAGMLKQLNVLVGLQYDGGLGLRASGHHWGPGPGMMGPGFLFGGVHHQHGAMCVAHAR